MNKEHHLVENLENALLYSRSNVPKELLVKPSIAKLLFNAFSDWCIIIFCWMLLAFISGWLYLPVALVIAGRLHAFGVILHDLAHMPLKEKTFKIRLLEILTGYPIGSTLNSLRYHHLRHHKDSGMATDPYFLVTGSTNPLVNVLISMRLIFLIPFWYVGSLYGSLAYYFPKMRQSYGTVFLQDKSGKSLTDSKEVIQCAREVQFQFLFHLVVFSMVIFYFGLKVFLLFYLIPIGFTGLFSGLRVMMEHHYISVTDRKMETIIKTTIDHHLNGIMKFFLAPRNIGYHIVHHLHPQVAWYHLPRLREWYLRNHPEIYPAKEQSGALINNILNPPVIEKQI